MKDAAKLVVEWDRSERICPYCQSTFKPRRPRQVFCTSKCGRGMDEATRAKPITVADIKYLPRSWWPRLNSPYQITQPKP